MLFNPLITSSPESLGKTPVLAVTRVPVKGLSSSMSPAAQHLTRVTRVQFATEIRSCAFEHRTQTPHYRQRSDLSGGPLLDATKGEPNAFVTMNQTFGYQ